MMLELLVFEIDRLGLYSVSISSRWRSRGVAGASFPHIKSAKIVLAKLPKNLYTLSHFGTHDVLSST